MTTEEKENVAKLPQRVKTWGSPLIQGEIQCKLIEKFRLVRAAQAIFGLIRRFFLMIHMEIG